MPKLTKTKPIFSVCRQKISSAVSGGYWWANFSKGIIDANKRLIIKLLTAFSALRAGKVFAADNICVIASCREDADIIAGALKVLKAHTGNAEHYNLITENIRMILVARNRHLPPFLCLAQEKTTGTAPGFPCRYNITDLRFNAGELRLFIAG